MAEGKTEFIGLSFQSKANSHKNRDLFIKFLSKVKSSLNIQIAIGRSKLGHFFLMSAGARLTVILVPGNQYQEFFMAVLTLSRLSWIAASPNQTIEKDVIQFETSTSTSILIHSSQLIATELIFVIIIFY